MRLHTGRSRLLILPLAVLAASCPAPERRSTGFAETDAALSGPGGYFDTDNLISNERSYLHAISDLRAAGIHGGAYLGVGPGQNFSYIAEIDPELAIIVDIRRDNVLQHLIYKALFEAAPGRLEFLALLTGRPVPDDAVAWRTAPLDSILAVLDRAPATPRSAEAARRLVRDAVGSYGFTLQPGDLETIDRFHGEFIRGGLDLRFRSHGRSPQFYYPTLRELLREVDREGAQASYVSSPERYERVRAMELEDRVIPVVADLGGESALGAVASYLRERGLVVTAFYTSNVEFYLFGGRTFDRWIDNLRGLPRAEDAVVIKSFFPGGFRGAHPAQLPGYYSTQVVQDAADLIDGWDSGRYRDYWSIVTRGLVGLQPVP